MMRMNRCSLNSFVWFAVAVLVTCWWGCQSQAQEPLRWKFAEGDKLNYELVQNSSMTFDTGAQGKVTATSKSTRKISWKVIKVDSEGVAIAEQSIDHVKLKTESPGQTMEYDSRSEEAPQGMAAMMAPLFDAMTAGKMQFTITPLGQVKDVSLSEELEKALANIPNGNPAITKGIKSNLEKTASQLALELPEGPPTSGQEWTTHTSVEVPMLGQQTMDTSYRYDGTEDIDGTKYAVILPTMKLGSVAGETAKMDIKDQKSSGRILFNPEAGILHSSHVQQDLTVDLSMMGQTIPATIQNVNDVSVTSGE